MGDISNSLKTQMGSKFAGNNSFSDAEGFQTYQDFKSALPEGEVEEKWSEKYKKSIDCKNPKGFSQRAHCQVKKKKTENKEATGASGAGQFSGPLFGDIKKEETKEATGSGSSGSYETPAAWVKSMTKKNWRGKTKTQIPGGKFVTVKQKCKKFPYCNQGDIKALKIYENEIVKSVISKISKEQNINETIIKAVIQYELEKKGNKLIK
jgi:hypothetical protein